MPQWNQKYVEPMKYVRSKHVYWVIAPLYQDYQAKLSDFISHLLDHEGRTVYSTF